MSPKVQAPAETGNDLNGIKAALWPTQSETRENRRQTQSHDSDAAGLGQPLVSGMRILRYPEQ